MECVNKNQILIMLKILLNQNDIKHKRLTMKELKNLQKKKMLTILTVF